MTYNELLTKRNHVEGELVVHSTTRCSGTVVLIPSSFHALHNDILRYDSSAFNSHSWNMIIENVRHI